MNYTKPEVVALGVAINAIQGSGKESDQVVDISFQNPTTTAYQADE